VCVDVEALPPPQVHYHPAYISDLKQMQQLQWPPILSNMIQIIALFTCLPQKHMLAELLELSGYHVYKLRYVYLPVVGRHIGYSTSAY